MSKDEESPALSHIGPTGEARMVDVGDKAVTVREATASGSVRMKTEVLDSLMSDALRQL